MEKSELFEIGNSSEEEENPVVDEDITSQNDIESQFTHQYTISSEEATSLKRVYALCLASNSQFTKIATGMSDGIVQIFDVRSASHLEKISPITTAALKSTSICGVKFLDENSLLVGKTNGKIYLYDLRTNQIAETFEDKSDERCKPIICFDTNANERIICAGTEQVSHDSFVLFFDIRQKQTLGGYWESHQDDITSVRFHPKKSDLLITGSTDGLVNIFDISEESEDDAIQMTLNTDSSVHRLNWHKNVYDKDIISCITHTNDLQLYEAEEGDLISTFERATVTTAMKRKFEGDCSLINCHNLSDDSIFLLAGSNYKKGDCLRSLKLLNKNLLPLASFEDNKQIVRDSIYDIKSGTLVTSGESGIVTIWTENVNKVEANSESMKMSSKSNKKLHKKKPY